MEVDAAKRLVGKFMESQVRENHDENETELLTMLARVWASANLPIKDGSKYHHVSVSSNHLDELSNYMVNALEYR